jgi:hypothetical protein
LKTPTHVLMSPDKSRPPSCPGAPGRGKPFRPLRDRP